MFDWDHSKETGQDLGNLNSNTFHLPQTNLLETNTNKSRSTIRTALWTSSHKQSMSNSRWWSILYLTIGSNSITWMKYSPTSCHSKITGLCILREEWTLMGIATSWTIFREMKTKKTTMMNRRWWGWHSRKFRCFLDKGMKRNWGRMTNAQFVWTLWSSESGWGDYPASISSIPSALMSGWSGNPSVQFADKMLRWPYADQFYPFNCIN